ncbi:hypothetical protein Gasu2_09100 [Galdieria sulphuraria]|uniref:BAR domain-containing protein n=1 Tax=Galdieria sulphuraria TaxID=130081 RepID=M2X911_GALSU|nr:uncharacterized protein Gasu_60380 [Galdieria sulphuraria]EME26307.1 hypothetical protein Gasu_60380 [Galdieria sulphuraria]GJD06497.1 hypothetical protein Gasu2_09100 [Galdieria sulphuraria]|eukprot:XP_005702827.1 hypothetical protein Gasu_60380 [Galdieria sulphuraria]
MSKILWGRTKSRNLEVEHWMHSLEEVEQVVKSVEPKLVSTTAKWKGIAQNCKDIATDLCQIFNKNDPHYEVLLASYTCSRKFEDEQHQVTKTNQLRDRAVERLRHYLSEIQQLKAQIVEEHKLRTRLEHYQAKVKDLENRHSDSNKLERNIAKLKDVDNRYRNFTYELTKQMEVCWKKHVSLFAEACVALWYTEFSLSAKLFESAESIRPFIARHLHSLHDNSAHQHSHILTVAVSQVDNNHNDDDDYGQIEQQSPISEEAFGSLECNSLDATTSQLDRTHLLDHVWRMSSVLNSSSSSNNSSYRHPEQPNTSSIGRSTKQGNSNEAYSAVSQSPQTNL